MRKIICLVVLFVSLSLWASEKEDLLFIRGLFMDKHYDMALDESVLFMKRYPVSTMNDDIILIQANIFIYKSDYLKAEKMLNNLLEKKSNPAVYAQVLLALGELNYQKKEYDQALSYVNEFLQSFPKHPETQKAYLIAGNIELAKSSAIRALDYYQQASEFGFNPLIKLKQIETYLSINDFPKADSVYQDIAKASIEKNDKEFAEVLILRYYEQKRQYDKIITIIPDSLDLNNYYKEELLYLKTNALLETREFDKALQFLKNNDLKTEKQEYYYALTLIKLNQLEEGVQLLDKLTSSAKNNDIKTISFFQKISLISQSNADSANVLLNDFLINNPDQKWVGDIHYQIAFNLFKKKNYNDALTHLDQALSFSTDKNSLEKALFLKGEVQFFLYKKSEVTETYRQFITNYPLSSLIDEAIFKLAVSYYNNNLPDSAKVYFEKIITLYPKSTKIGMANYYLGEIDLANGKYSSAKTYFDKALTGISDQGVIHLRLSYIEYLRKNYTSAKEILNNVPEEDAYLFDKYLLKGNISFAEKAFTEAINHYKKAEKNSPDQVSLEHLWSREAWTYYRLKQYDQATKLYKQLSEQSTAPGKYTLSAASAAYNAENYNQSLELYQSYVKDYSDSKEYYKALGGIANSYFNMGNYRKAIEAWEKLINPVYPLAIIENAVQGIQWSYQYLNDKREFSRWINDEVRKISDSNLKLTLLEAKIKFEYEQQDFRTSLTSIQQLIRLFPEKKQDEKLQIMQANNYVWLKQYERADSIYVTLVLKNKDPQIYHEWGHIKWAQGDTLAAIKRYKKAADTSKQEDFWLVLLEKQVLANDKDFEKYYNTFISFANPYYQELAKLILVDFKISKTKYDEGLSLAQSLDVSDNPLVRVKAIYSKAYIFYLQKNYEQAQKEFFRIRYVFTEYAELRWNAEYYLCMIYLENNEKDKANELYEQIKDKISTTQSDSLSQKIKGRN